MGRKKKTAPTSDSRGYCQGPAVQNHHLSSRGTSSLTQQTHHHMKELLDQFSNHSSNHQSKTCVIEASPSDRFPSKLSNIVDKLDELGFTVDQIEQAAIALQYDISLENALDYLCLHVDTMELPPLFTDPSLREDRMTVSTAESLVVVNNKKHGAASRSENCVDREFACRYFPVPSKVTECVEDHAKKIDNRAEQKKWLLRQYEYVDDDNEDVTNSAGLDSTKSQALPLTTDQQMLVEKEKELNELEDDLKNDANNYMRSKQEIQDLQLQAKKLRQHVQRLKGKLERNQTAQKQQHHQESKQPEECETIEYETADSEDCGGFFDIFGQTRHDESAPAEAKQPQEQRAKLLDYPIPKGWTGITPEKKLDEVCRRHNLLKPKYTKLPANSGIRLSILVAKKQPPMEWEAITHHFLPGSSLKDYLAMHALYTIDSVLPLYHLFPPAFRNLWISWDTQKLDEIEQARKKQSDVKQQRIDRLVSLISNSQMNSKNTATIQAVKAENTAHAILTENWDNEDKDADKMISISHVEPTSIGKKMQEDFMRLQLTADYIKMKALRDDLPMSSFRENILDTVQEHAVTILCADTGAGKTTQCPQYILEQALLEGRGDKTQIICTQPRRVAATSVAERVAKEMCDELGKRVGYQIRMEAKKSSQTKLLFCTTGIVLRRLQDDSDLAGVTHVLVDEVHERQQQTDVLLIILRTLPNTTRPDLKVILMSATLDSDLFCSYFNSAPLISVPGKMFPIKNYFLEDVLEATRHVIEEGSAYAYLENRYTDQTSLWMTTRGGDKRREVVDLTSSTGPVELSSMYSSYSLTTRRSMERVNEEVVNYDLIEDVLMLLLVGDQSCHALNADGVDLSTGNILIFFPGIGEIKTMTERLEGSRTLNRSRFAIIPMHSTLSSRDQRRAFVQTKLRKIILSTNICETSITIPDVVCVIDTGRVRELRHNKRTLTSQLTTDWCSRASAKQRLGRAGRVRPGLCFKLYSSFTANTIMQPTSLPELHCAPLEEICLSILASGFAKSCRDFLSKAPQPPSNDNIIAALTVLQDIGAIERYDQNQFERLSPLGHHLAKLPVDVRLGKMLLFACLFNCIDPILTVAASLSSQSPFSTFVNDAAVASAKQRAFSDSDSDFLTYCNIWDAYIKATKTSTSAEFCHENYLNHVSLREIGSARKHFIDLLSGIGFLDRSMLIDDDRRIDEQKLKLSSFNKQAKNRDVLHAVICAGLYSNVARLEQAVGFGYKMWHRDERIYFHQASVNSKKRYSKAQKWVVFDEKFDASKRTCVSTTCFIHPVALLLFGGKIAVKHIERLVIVDDWIEIEMAAQTSVMVREIKKQVDILVQKIIIRVDTKEIHELESDMIEGLCKILASSP